MSEWDDFREGNGITKDEKEMIIHAQSCMDKVEMCINGCGKPATWVRFTQFAGTHPFCTECAMKENDFGKEDPSYFCWEEIDKVTL